MKAHNKTNSDKIKVSNFHRNMSQSPTAIHIDGFNIPMPKSPLGIKKAPIQMAIRMRTLKAQNL